MPNSVVLGQTLYERHYGDLPKNLTPRPAFQGHSRSLEPTRIDRLPVLVSVVTIARSRTVSEINGDICQILPSLLYLTPTPAEKVHLGIL